jgi:cytochrome c peroxidase
MKKIIYFFAFTTLLISCKKKEGEFLITYPDYFPQPHYTFSNNDFSKIRFELGRKMFHDTKLSSDNSISCATCHAQVHAFADHGVSLSSGVNGTLGTRNSPAIFNMLWSKHFNWDGGVNHLEIFPFAPITNPLEMNEDISNVLQKLNADNHYKKLFEKAYGSTEITDQLLYRALAVFMGALISSDSKYDKMRKGKATFTTSEQRGYNLFQQNCNSCHTEPLFHNNAFANNGLDEEFADFGRYLITQNEADKGVFKIPTLRNIELTYPYMHDGRFQTLSQVINHYSDGIKQSVTLHPLLSQNLQFSTTDKQDLMAFLRTLTDYSFISKHEFSE